MLELLTTIVVVSVLVALLLPVTLRARGRAATAICLNNLQQLQTCWQLYADDHNGLLVGNESVFTNGFWRSNSDSWIGSTSALTDIGTGRFETGLFWRLGYNRSVAIYLCPADRAWDHGGRRPGRSVSLSGCMGGRTNEIQRVYTRVDQIARPSQMFAFIDESAETIDDGHFLVWPAPDDRWVNLAADRHSGCGVLSFADGHVEVWRWRTPKRFKPKTSYWKRADTADDLADLRRLQQASAPRP